MRILARHPFTIAAVFLVTFTILGMAPIKPTKVANPSVRIELGGDLGSGIYIGNGMVITAAHVVGDSPTAKIKTDTGDEQTGDILWSNKDYDIAAIRVSNPERLIAAPLICRAPIIGEHVTSDGNPVGLDFVTMNGFVAAPARDFLPKWKSALILDMTVISGMSGGGVLDQFGEVIGITVGAVDPHSAVGFPAMGGMGMAVPSSGVCALIGRA